MTLNNYANSEPLHSSWLRCGCAAVRCKGRVVDIGCRTGDLALAVAGFGLEVYALGIDKVEIERAKQKAQQLGLCPRFALWDGGATGLPAASFDTVIVSSMPGSMILAEDLIGEAFRLCAHQGKLIIQHVSDTSIDKRRWQRFLVSLCEQLGSASIQWVDRADFSWWVAAIDFDKGNLAKSSYVSRNEVDSYFQEPLHVPALDMSQKVSVIIPTYNRASLLISSLESILNQSYKNMEVFVVNDGSTDETEEKLKPCLDRIHYLKKENGGKSSAINMALSRVTGKYVWIFDDDDIALPTKLELDVRAFQENPDVGVTYSHGYTFENTIPQITSADIAVAYPDEEIFLKILADGIFFNPTMVVRKKCYDQVGFYREDLLRGQDWEMMIRLAEHFKFYSVNLPTILVRIHYGPRGPEKDRFILTPKHNPSSKYGRIIFAELYKKLPLAKYSVALTSNPNDVFSKGEALIERARIMLKHRLCNFALRDLSSVEELAKIGKLTVNFHIVDRVLNLFKKEIAFGNLQMAFEIVTCLKRMITAVPGRREFELYVTKRIYWSAMESFRALKLYVGARKLIMLGAFLFSTVKPLDRKKVCGKVAENAPT